MSRDTLLITPQLIKDKTTLHNNVDDKFIYPEIKAVQDMFIRPLVGSTLMDKLQTDKAAGTLAGAYLLLVDNYLTDCICNYVLSELPENINYQFYNKGLGGKNIPEGNSPSMSDMYAIIAKYKTRAEHYTQATRKYLLQNAPTLYPEYRIFVTGIDTVYPDKSAYTSPIYLGDESELPRDDYSLENKRPPFNSNDPYYYNL